MYAEAQHQSRKDENQNKCILRFLAYEIFCWTAKLFIPFFVFFNSSSYNHDCVTFLDPFSLNSCISMQCHATMKMFLILSLAPIQKAWSVSRNMCCCYLTTLLHSRTHPTMGPSVCQYTNPPTHSFIHPSVRPSVRPSINASIHHILCIGNMHILSCSNSLDRVYAFASISVGTS